MTIDIPHYIPPFIWKFWLSTPGEKNSHARKSRIHVYDVYSSQLSEISAIPEHFTRRSIFQDFDSALYPGTRAALERAEQDFFVLESRAEDALARIISVVHSESGFSSKRINVDPSTLLAITKFFVFLRFRNSSKYHEIVRELMEPAEYRLATRNTQSSREALLSLYDPLIRQIRIKAVLEAFSKFFKVVIYDIKHSQSPPSTDMPSFRSHSTSNPQKDRCLDILNTYCWQFIRGAEICIGIADSDEEQEFVLPHCGFGVLDESFGGAVGGRKCPESEPFDSFFPILPTMSLYLLRGEDDWGDLAKRDALSYIEVGRELELDIHLRNAMILSTVPFIQRRETFIPFDGNTPVLEIDSLAWFPSNSHPQDASDNNQSMVDDMEVSDGSGTDINGPKLYFCSLRSLVRSISSYDEFRCRWDPENFIDYSRLKQRCRQKVCLEEVKRMLAVKRDILVIDLTDEIKVIGADPVAFGAFSDVWKGHWFDSVERKERVVAIKYLRQVMVQNVREKLFKRLQTELATWHQLCHRNVSSLYGIIQNSTSIGMVSPWCDNGTLSSYLRANPGTNKLKMLIQVASGVAYLHHFSPPVVHGDLKGGNILVDAHEQAIITDFGLSKVMEDLSSSMSEGERKIPTSFFAGSTRWMAPELILTLVEDNDKAPQVTTSSDVYAFASVCLEIVTGDLPYPHRKNDYSVTVDILRGVTPSRGADISVERLGIGKASAETEEAFRGLLERCWDSVPYLRPNMEEVSKGLVNLDVSSLAC